MTPEQRRRQVFEFLLDFLGDNYVNLKIERYCVKCHDGRFVFESSLQEGEKEPYAIVSSSQDTVVEACAHALTTSLSESYASLEALTLGSSRTTIKPEGKLSKAEVGVTAGSRRIVYFSALSPSSLGALVSCVVSAVEYYLNAERAFLKLRPLVDEARSRNRGDLVQKYQIFMSRLVEINDYERVSL